MKFKKSLFILSSVLLCNSVLAANNELKTEANVLNNQTSFFSNNEKSDNKLSAQELNAQTQALNSSFTSEYVEEKEKQKTPYSLEEQFRMSAKDPVITDMQKTNLQKVNKYKSDKSNQTAFVNRDNVVFAYGTQNASVVTSVLTVTDIELEPGEIINSVNVGDPSRWNVEPAVTGLGENQTQHVLVKPLDIGLKTNMLIATDRRAYRIDLSSTNDQFYPHVSFSYPEKLLAAFEAQRIAMQSQRDKQSITTTVNNDGSKSRVYLGDLNFDYTVEGSVSWKPIRVYDDGRKTIIEMPKKVEYAKAPALMLLTKKGSVFTDEQTDIINYRLQDNKYVVDGIFETAILTMGLDSQQQRVVIKRN